MARVHVDFDLCASTGNCTRAVSEVFEIRSDGYLYILGGYDADLPDDLVAAVQVAVDECPTQAISIVES